ncbi:serine/threonine-protein kinase [Streptomyces sp. NPDC046985]|uniref:serine/threonine-protein kinase n=1 Tax=Streptomyces sp. NPDC046985 TaxID=3155377 RepID=UPI0034040566
MPLPTALYTGACAADALDAAHEAGLTHRDIKPSHIMVRNNGEATVVDSGITKGSDAGHDITATDALIGTPAYMAPEALSGTFDHRSDLYSLGCVLFEAITGRRPFIGTSWHLTNQHLKEPPALPRTLRPDAPVELEQLVSRLLAKDPAHRPDSADEVYDLIEEINDRYFGDTPPPSRGAGITPEVWLSLSGATGGAAIPMRLTAPENRRPGRRRRPRIVRRLGAASGPFYSGAGRLIGHRMKAWRIGMKFSRGFGRGTDFVWKASRKFGLHSHRIKAMSRWKFIHYHRRGPGGIGNHRPWQGKG